jgi:hypothetical protein
MSDEMDAAISAAIGGLPAETPGVVDVPAETTETSANTSATGADAVVADATGHSEEAVDAPPPTVKPEDETLDLVPERDARGRKNRIPHDRVKVMVENARKAAVAEREKAIRQQLELAEDAQLDLGAFHGEVKSAKEQRKHYEDMTQAEKLMQEDVDEFVRRAASILPAWQKYLPKPPEQQKQAQVPEEAPGPDLDLGDGRRTFSVEGLQKRMEWEREQGVKAAEERLGGRLAQLEQARQAEQKSREVVETRQQAEKRATERWNSAEETWPDFKEHGEEIAKVLLSDRKITLEAAYAKVVFPKQAEKFRLNEEAVRKKVADELNARPSSTSIVANPVATAVSSGDPVEDAIRQQMAKLG